MCLSDSNVLVAGLSGRQKCRIWLLTGFVIVCYALEIFVPGILTNALLGVIGLLWIFLYLWPSCFSSTTPPVAVIKSVPSEVPSSPILPDNLSDSALKAADFSGGGEGGSDQQSNGAQNHTVPLNTSNATALASDPAKAKTGTSSPRLYYLDNIKTALTALVIVHHVAMTYSSCEGWWSLYGCYYSNFGAFSIIFQSLNQGYFMAMFFFISGYFTPSSYKRKGVLSFLKDKFYRLGIPFFVVFFGLFPLLNYLTVQEIGGFTFQYYGFPGPLWFVWWLLLFNTAYVFLADPASTWMSSNVRLPSAGCMLAWSLLFTLLGIPLLLTGGFIMMPVPHMFVLYAASFAAGTFAKGNRWLTEDIPNMSTCDRWIYRSVVLIQVAMVIGLYTWAYKSDGAGILPSADTDSSTSSSGGEEEGIGALTFIPYLVMLGPYCVSMQIVMLDFAYQWWNQAGKWTKLLARDAYAVYIIHPFIVVFVAWLYEQILSSAKNYEPVWQSEENSWFIYSEASLGPDSFLWLGWLFTSLVSVTLCWLIADPLRRLPVLRSII